MRARVPVAGLRRCQRPSTRTTRSRASSSASASSSGSESSLVCSAVSRGICVTRENHARAPARVKKTHRHGFQLASRRYCPRSSTVGLAKKPPDIFQFKLMGPLYEFLAERILTSSRESLLRFFAGLGHKREIFFKTAWKCESFSSSCHRHVRNNIIVGCSRHFNCGSATSGIVAGTTTSRDQTCANVTSDRGTTWQRNERLCCQSACRNIIFRLRPRPCVQTCFKLCPASPRPSCNIEFHV